MANLNDVIDSLQHLAPEDTALPDDPVGLLINRTDAKIRKIGVCLDATPDIAQQAVEASVSLLVAHHPLIYRPLTRINAATDPIARAVAILVKADICHYAMHTNWDAATGGINDSLAQILGLHNIRRLGECGALALPRVGDTSDPIPLGKFIQHIEAMLGCSGTSAVRSNSVRLDTPVSTVAVCGGAGAFLVPEIIASGSNIYVTSDVRHHEFLDASGRGFALIDAGHEATETPGMRALTRILAEQFHDVEVAWFGRASANGQSAH